LTINTSLTTFNAEGNKIGVKGLTALHEATCKNRTLLDWVIPMEDVTKLCKGSSDKKTKETVLKIVHDLEMNMERNQKALRNTDVKVSGMTAQELDNLLNSTRGLPSLRMSSVNDESYIGESSHAKHRKTASRLLDMMSQQSDSDDPHIPQQQQQRSLSPARSASPTGRKPEVNPVSPSGPSPPTTPGTPGTPGGTNRAPPVPTSTLKTVKGVSTAPVGSPTTLKSQGSFRSTPSTPTGTTSTSNNTTPAPKTPTSPEMKYDDWKTKTYPFEKVEFTIPAENLPPGVNPQIRELYLDHDRFVELFDGMSKDEYQKLPRWKQNGLKKKNGFF